LATTDDARVHCAVLKIRAVPVPATSEASGRPVLLRMPTSGRSLRTQQRARPARPSGEASRAAVCCHTARPY